MNKVIIGLTGKARAGKSTAAEQLVSRMGFEEHAFAEKLKRILMNLLNLTEYQVYDQEGKLEIDPRYGKTPRHLMQWFGQVVRDELPDAWEQALGREIAKLNHNRPIVISDIRYAGEAEMVRALGGKIIQIVRPDPPMPLLQKLKRLFDRTRWHKSERGIPRELVDMIIINDGSLQQFQEAAVAAAWELFEERKK